MEFHEKLQKLRASENLTQEELAEKLYVSRTAISKWESGRGYPSIDSLKTIAKYFNITGGKVDLTGIKLANNTKVKEVMLVTGANQGYLEARATTKDIQTI